MSAANSASARARAVAFAIQELILRITISADPIAKCSAARDVLAEKLEQLVAPVSDFAAGRIPDIGYGFGPDGNIRPEASEPLIRHVRSASRALRERIVELTEQNRVLRERNADLDAAFRISRSEVAEKVCVINDLRLQVQIAEGRIDGWQRWAEWGLR